MRKAVIAWLVIVGCAAALAGLHVGQPWGAIVSACCGALLALKGYWVIPILNK